MFPLIHTLFVIKDIAELKMLKVYTFVSLIVQKERKYRVAFEELKITVLVAYTAYLITSSYVRSLDESYNIVFVQI